MASRCARGKPHRSGEPGKAGTDDVDETSH